MQETLLLRVRKKKKKRVGRKERRMEGGRKAGRGEREKPKSGRGSWRSL